MKVGISLAWLGMLIRRLTWLSLRFVSRFFLATFLEIHHKFDEYTHEIVDIAYSGVDVNMREKNFSDRWEICLADKMWFCSSAVKDCVITRKITDVIIVLAHRSAHRRISPRRNEEKSSSRWEFFGTLEFPPKILCKIVNKIFSQVKDELTRD